LLGDLTTQQPRDSRLVDASTSRVEITLNGPDGSIDEQWEIRIEGHNAPLNRDRDENGDVLISGARYRSFVPWLGLHPNLPARDRIRFTLLHRPSNNALELVLHDWRPDGAPYPGLPTDRLAAAERRQQRVTIRALRGDELPTAKPPAPAAVGPYCLDLRRVK